MTDSFAVAVLLGTDHHPFVRAVEWASTLAATDGRGWLLQHGYTPVPTDLPGNVVARDILTVDELAPLLAAADVVITHGGPGLVMEARAAGHLPIVIARDPDHGEHVDGHQLDFATRLEDAGTIRRVTSLDELAAAVAEASAAPRPLAGGTGTNPDTVAAFAAAVDDAVASPRVPFWRRVTRS